VVELRRGREQYQSDERILGSSSFIEEIVKEAGAQAEGKDGRNHARDGQASY